MSVSRRATRVMTHPHLLEARGTLGERNSHALRPNRLQPLGPNRNDLESLSHPLLQRIQVLFTRHDKLHPPRAVILCPPIYQLLSGVPPRSFRIRPQRLVVARSEFRVRVVFAHDVLLQLEEPPHVGLEVLLVLRVDRFDLSLGAVLPSAWTSRGGRAYLVEEWLGEEARKAV